MFLQISSILSFQQSEFARELNECMLAGCTGYIYWYMRAHWAFVGTGESQYGSGNTKNKLLPRAYVMSHFSRNVTGSTRLETKATFTTSTNSDLECSAYIKGDSIIVMAINSTGSDHDLRLRFPYFVKSGTHVISTGNEKAKLYQESAITLEESAKEAYVSMPAKSVNTYILMIDRDTTDAIHDVKLSEEEGVTTYYDLQGRPLDKPQGLCIEKFADGSSRKVYIRN